MVITFPILIESMGDYPVIARSSRKASFTAVTTSPLFNCRKSKPASEAQVLFIGSPDDARRFLSSNKRAFALVLASDDSVIESLTDQADRFCAVNVGSCFDEAMATCQATVARYSQWQDAMKNALLNGGDYQNVLSLSEDILVNFVSISDSAFRLLAYTRGIPIDDPIANSLVAHGHHVQETIDLFRRNGIDRIWRKRAGLGVNRTSLTADGETLDYIFKMRGEYFTHVVMHCNNLPISHGLIDTFSILTDHLAYYVRQDWHTQHRIGPEYAKTLISLLSGKMRNSATAKEELRLAHIDDTARFRVYALSFKDELLTDKKQEMSYYLYRLLDLMPNEKAVAYDGRIVLLHEQGASNDSIDAQIAMFQNTYGGLCGASYIVDSIYDLPYAYEQACFALEACANSLSLDTAGLLEGTSGHIGHFEAYYPEFLLMSPKDNRLLAFCLKHSLTMRIKHDDEANGTDNLDILNAFLVGERKATSVSKLLHMHRNTLVYKMESMQKRYGLDLDDAHIRCALMTEYTLINASVVDAIDL